jgi:ELWxxDGT repeat protein
MNHPRRTQALPLTVGILLAGCGSGPQTSPKAAVYQVRDINPGPGSSDVGGLLDSNGTVFFTADDGVTGEELWASDGTSTGTRLVRDVRPGPDGSGISLLARAGSNVFFSADDGVHGTELWRSDGTADGTVMVQDIVPGAGDAFPGYAGHGAVVVNGTLYFPAYDPQHGRELWRSDGTASGTALVADIYPGSSYSSPDWLVDFKECVYFLAFSPVPGTRSGSYGLWKSDGTPEGTVLVRSFDSSSMWRRRVLRVGGQLFVTYYDYGGGRLWRCDGTDAGTVVIMRDYVDFMADANGTLFFGNGAKLWRSDGSEAGTVLVKDAGLAGSRWSASSIAVVGDLVFFSANPSGVSSEPPYALWRTDGSDKGTVMVQGGVFPDKLVAFQGRLFFSGYNPEHGRELWTSDGSAAGTVRLSDIAPGPRDSLGEWSTLGPGRALFFPADDDSVTGRELWAYGPAPR